MSICVYYSYKGAYECEVGEKLRDILLKEGYKVRAEYDSGYVYRPDPDGWGRDECVDTPSYRITVEI